MYPAPENPGLRRRIALLEYLAAGLWLVYLNASAILEFDQFPALESVGSRGWQIAWAGILVVLLMLALLRTSGRWPALIGIWRRSPWLWVFLALSAASLAWSVHPRATLYEVTLLLCSVIGASFVAVTFPGKRGLLVLLIFAGVCTVLSLLIVLFTPIGIMHGTGHAGSWRGLFWHRNHTGSLMAFFNLVFLGALWLFPPQKPMPKLALVLLYGLSALQVVASKSATSLVLFVALNAAAAGLFSWMRWRARLRTWHYLAAGASLILLGTLVLGNLDIVFGLLGRSSTMTGRTRMWPDLMLNTYPDRPFFGHGFGAIWMQEGFRGAIMERWHWSYQPYFADNGYIDLALNLGAAGLVVFGWGLVGTAARLLGRLRAGADGIAALYGLILLYVILANLTYSFLFEVDYFVWSLMILAWFSGDPAAPPAWVGFAEARISQIRRTSAQP